VKKKKKKTIVARALGKKGIDPKQIKCEPNPKTRGVTKLSWAWKKGKVGGQGGRLREVRKIIGNEESLGARDKQHKKRFQVPGPRRSQKLRRAEPNPVRGGAK